MKPIRAGARRPPAKQTTLFHFYRRREEGAPAECWLWKGAVGAKGYGIVRIFMFDQLFHCAHRLAWALANQRAVPAGKLILHSCDNPPCCNPAHLRVGSFQDNSDDAIIRSRTYGVSLETIRQIQQEDYSIPNTDLAAKYGVNRRTIQVYRRLPKHISLQHRAQAVKVSWATRRETK